LLALSRRPLRPRGRTGEMVHAWAVRMKDSARPLPLAGEGGERSSPGEGVGTKRQLCLGRGFPSSVAVGDTFSRRREKGRALPMLKQSFGDEGAAFPSP